jgi:predicted nucleic acid-binding protein
MKPKPKLFINASVFIAAAGSPNGGSAAVLTLCQQGRFQAISTRLVLLEAMRNTAQKLGEEALLRLYHSLADLDLSVEGMPSAEALATYGRIIGEKDAHVLAAAVGSSADFLLTLDRKHFMTEKVKRAKLPVTILTPADFLRRWLKEREK